MRVSIFNLNQVINIIDPSLRMFKLRKISEGYFSQYNPYSLKEFVKTFTKFRKGQKCTQDDVLRDLDKFMQRPLTKVDNYFVDN